MSIISVGPLARRRTLQSFPKILINSVAANAGVGGVDYNVSGLFRGSRIDDSDTIGSGLSAGSYTLIATAVDGSRSASLRSAEVVIPSTVSLSLSTISAAYSSLLNDGVSTTTITVQLKDVNGTNLISSGGTVVLSTDAGSLSAVTDNSNGSYTATLTSSTSVETATISGTLDGAALTDTAQVSFQASNEPAGMTQLLNADGSDKYFFAPATNVTKGAAWDDPTIYPQCNNNTRVAAIADASAPHGYVIRKWILQGEGSGFRGYYAREGNPGFGSATGYSEMYFRIIVRFSANWHWDYSSTQKLFYWGANRVNAGGMSANGFFVSIDESQIDFVDQANSTVPVPGVHAADGTAYNVDYRYNPTGGAPSIASLIQLDQFITVEVWHKANSAYNVADGQARVWVNGNELTSYMGGGLSNKIWTADSIYYASDTMLNDIQTFLYWGGSGDTAPDNMYVDLAELYISGKAA